MMLPGAAGARSAPPRSMFVVTPVMPPAMSARIRIGFISAYGKYTSWMPPKNWMTRRTGSRGARRADAEERERQQQSDTGAGVGLEQEEDRRSFLGGLLRCPSGVSTPWLMALLRNSTFAGSIDDARERQQVHRRRASSTALPRTCMTPLTSQAIG